MALPQQAAGFFLTRLPKEEPSEDETSLVEEMEEATNKPAEQDNNLEDDENHQLD